LSRLTLRSVSLAAAVLAAAVAAHAESVAMGSFTHVDLERNDPDTSASIATLLQAAMGDTPGRTFVERQEAQKLMDELGLAALGESDAESASRIGKLLRADVMLTGTFATSDDGRPYVVLETTELARAEPLGQARVDLDKILVRGQLVVPGRDDMKRIAAAAAALLDESRDKIEAGKGKFSIKFLGFAHDIGDTGLGTFEAQLAAAIDSAAAATGNHRVLSLERADVATQESEFALLGLAEADAQAFEKVANYFVWGSVVAAPRLPPQMAQLHPQCVSVSQGPELSVKVWDGRHPPLEFREPLNLGTLHESAVRLAAKAIAAAAPTPDQVSGVPAPGKGIARLFLDQEALREREARSPESPSTAAARRLEEEQLLSAAVFFYPASSEAWFRLQRLRMPSIATAGRASDIKREVQAVQFTLEAAKRFLVTPDGKIDPAPIDGFFGAQSFNYEDRFSRLKREVATLQEDFHDIYLSHNIDGVIERLSADYRSGVVQLCRELARAAPGQEDAYRRSASALLFTVFDNDFPKADRITVVRSLAPRLKVAILVHRAWYPAGDRLDVLEPLLRAELVDEGMQADADAFDTLSAGELEQAERAEAPPNSPAGEKAQIVAMEERAQAGLRASTPATAASAPGAAVMASHGQAALGEIEALHADVERLKRQAMLFLETHAAGWTWTPAAEAPLLSEPPDEQLGIFNPPLESLPAPRRSEAVAWLRQEASNVVLKGYPPQVAEAIGAKADAVERAPEPTPVPGQPVRQSTLIPGYTDPKAGSYTLADFASKGDIASMEALFKEGVPPAYAGEALFFAIQREQWPAAHFILESGYDPAAPWPDQYIVSVSDIGSSDTAARIALAAAIGAGRQDLTNILLQKGVRFGAESAASGRMITTLARRRAVEPLRQMLAAGSVAGGAWTPGEKRPLFYALQYRDTDLLGVLLNLGCNVDESVSMTAFTQMKAANSQQWIRQDPYADTALGLAASINWLEGSRLMIEKSRQKPSSILSRARLDMYATQASVRSLFVHEELESFASRESEGKSGIALFSAIAARDSSAFESAVAVPRVLQFRGFGGETPLMFAIREREPSLAGRLIDAGSSIEATDFDGATPLCHACAEGDGEIVEALIRHGANPNGANGSAPTPLEQAIDSAHDTKLALRLVELGANLQASPLRPGFVPLFRAAWEDMPDLVAKLMALGSDPLQIAHGYTIMFSAAHSNDPDLIQMLFEKGCDPRRQAPNGWTPLTTAVRWGAADAARKLIELGVRDPHAASVSVSMVTDIEPPDRPQPQELQRLAYVPDYQRCVELMEESGQLDQSQEAGDSIFWHRGHTESEIEAHLAAGGNVNFVGALTPLQAVLGDFDAAKVKLLLAHGADPNLPGLTNRPPLEMALGSPEIARIMLEHGADPNRFNIMWYAVSSDSVSLDVVRILVHAGGALGIGSEETLAILGKRNPERADAVRKILSGG
jgi:ankyrin repeat protein